MSLPSEPEANEFRFEVLRVDGEFLSGSYRSSTDLGEIQSVRFTEAGELAAFEGWGLWGQLEIDLERLRLTDAIGFAWPLEEGNQTLGPDVTTSPRHLRIETRPTGLWLRWEGRLGSHQEVMMKDDWGDAWLPLVTEPFDPTLSELKLLNTSSVRYRFFGIRERVVVNGTSLDGPQLAEIEQHYGVAPRPGRYWYDTESGLYGVVGFPAFGFMKPGHDFGPVSDRASNGNSGVMINGRELSLSEWGLWSLTLKSPIQEGNYWLDQWGNVGVEGQSLPLFNFAVAASGRVGGGGQSSDGFWTSRWSAGNVNAQGEGYVSVPGHGPVDFGF